METTLRKVAWCSLWNRAAARNTDVGSLIHLTDAPGTTGKTLCGREYPADKGHPAAARLCKRCRGSFAARDTSGIKLILAGLEWVPNQEGF